jgi:nitrogen-specific signal transduction histidine kinase
VHASWIEETGQICAALQDITKQRVLERGMALHEKAALFERLAGGLAHELNNKLTPVVGYADLLSLRLQGLPEAAKALRQCQTISSSAAEAVRMVRQLLQLSRPPQAEKASCDLNGLVQEAWTIVDYKLRSGEVDCSLDLPAGKVPVHVDGSQIKQVLVNLVINAIDAMESSARKRLRLSLKVEGPSAILSLQDSGQGIPQENLLRIFDPFFTTKAPDRGTGLGLSVCLSILQQHHGDIQVSSTPGEGSTFTIELPLAEAGTLSASPVIAPFPARAGWDHAPRVLAIDDETHVTELIRATLQAQWGWTVETCQDMGEALARLGRQAFDLVLTDLRMPGLDGFTLLSWVKAHRPALLARLLVITADPGEMDLEAAWGVRVLRKPFRSAELVQMCQSMLPGHPAAGALGIPPPASCEGENQDSAYSGVVTNR